MHFKKIFTEVKNCKKLQLLQIELTIINNELKNISQLRIYRSYIELFNYINIFEKFSLTKFLPLDIQKKFEKTIELLSKQKS